MEAGNFCESDKYSLCMMLNQIAPSQRDMMISQIGSQIEGNEEGLRDVAKESMNIGSVYRSLNFIRVRHNSTTRSKETSCSPVIQYWKAC